MLMTNLLLVIIASTFLLSCAETRSHITSDRTAIKTQKTSTKNIKYTCNRDTTLSINFISSSNESDKSTAIINGFGKQAIILSNKTVASGFLYSNGKYTLRGKGDHAIWTVGRMVPFQCSVGDKLNLQKDLK
jgi:membrane-bound inhibitor of C-type lysozyme